MGKVIGPFDSDTWGLLRDLRQDIKDYSSDPTYKVAEEKSRNLYKYMLTKYSKSI